jgi:molybdopterin-guanine dinucleotide biosynthesis protein MobB
VKRVCFVGYSGSGKTRLVKRLVAWLARRGYRVGTLKHAHHDFDMDRKGKDSHRHFEAGAAVSAVVSPKRSAVFRRTPFDWKRQFRGCDILIIEGFRRERFSKIEVYRRAVAPKPLFRKEGFRIRGLVTSDPVSFDGPTFKPGQIERIAKFVMQCR